MSVSGARIAVIGAGIGGLAVARALRLRGAEVTVLEQAEAIARVADGVVVGSALVEIVAEHGENAPQHLRALVEKLANAVHSAR